MKQQVKIMNYIKAYVLDSGLFHSLYANKSANDKQHGGRWLVRGQVCQDAWVMEQTLNVSIL